MAVFGTAFASILARQRRIIPPNASRRPRVSALR
uniref:Uncharacterized protein n=1 Tax=Arundo donax TaxID=35708 RepID=A0A0A9HSC8_ARUDO